MRLQKDEASTTCGFRMGFSKLAPRTVDDVEGTQEWGLSRTSILTHDNGCTGKPSSKRADLLATTTVQALANTTTTGKQLQATLVGHNGAAVNTRTAQRLLVDARRGGAERNRNDDAQKLEAWCASFLADSPGSSAWIDYDEGAAYGAEGRAAIAATVVFGASCKRIYRCDSVR